MGRPSRGSLYETPSANPIAQGFSLLLRALVAYALAFWLYVFLYRFAQSLRDYGFTDPGMRLMMVFFLVLGVVIALVLPLFAEDWGSGTKILCLMTAFILVVITLTQAAGFLAFDATASLDGIFRQNFVPWFFDRPLPLPGRR